MKNNRNDFLDDILKNINSEEYQEKAKKRLEDYKKKLTPSYQLGYYVGEDIVLMDLPTLSTDMLLSRKVIKVSDEDTEVNKQLDEEWRKSYRGAEKDPSLKDLSDEKWGLLRENRRYLDMKYLPETLKCIKRTLNLSVLNLEEFKQGLQISLYDCDMCSYSLKDEDITFSEDDYFTIITLIRAEK